MNITCKELYELIDIKRKCSDCTHFCSETTFMNKTHYLCNLSNVIMPNEYSCGLYNKDLSKEPICYNCKYYLGGSDWGLSCGADYQTLTGALEEKCNKFEEKENG